LDPKQEAVREYQRRLPARRSSPAPHPRALPSRRNPILWRRACCNLHLTLAFPPLPCP
jgi:hypothetical protein